MSSNGWRSPAARGTGVVVGLLLLIAAVGSLLRRPAGPAVGPAGRAAALSNLPAAAVAADASPLPEPPPTDPPPGYGLTARNLLLIVNQNEPAGRRLADFYAAQRRVPPGRVFALDLPVADEVSFDDYNAKVVPAARAFLTDRKLTDEVTCLVTFYGVPLRVGPRTNSPAEAAEYREVTAGFRTAADAARQAVAVAEELAKQADPAFTPAAVTEDFANLVARADAASAAALAVLAADADATRRASRFARLTAATEAICGHLETVRRLDLPAYRAAGGRAAAPDPAGDAGPAAPAGDAATRVAATRAAAIAQELGPLTQASAAGDPVARARARVLVAENLGAFGSIQLLSEQKRRLETGETEAAVDSELACLWWPDDRPRFRWHDNPLHYADRFAPPGRRPPPRTLMVTRVDAPTEQLAHDLIATSVRVEAAGLGGTVALDARGKPPTDAYGQFDDTLRTLASDLPNQSPVKVALDDGEPVFPPGTVPDVALYCGWYSLRHYVPGMTFVPGAVGYHVASLELLTLHNPAEKGWVRGLMTDGVVATVGAVAEPYLHAFPLPTEFFPLLGTGRLTLAEAYWATTPLVSWMTTCVGDPLYRPYAVKPLVKAVNVAPRLRPIFTGHTGPPVDVRYGLPPGTPPATRPTPSTRPTP